MSKKYDTSEEIILKQIQHLQSTAIAKNEDEVEDDVVENEILSAKLLQAKKLQETKKKQNLQKNLSYLNHNKPTDEIIKGIKQVRKEEIRKKKKKNKVEEGERILGPGFLERYGEPKDKRKKKKDKKEKKEKNKRKREQEIGDGGLMEQTKKLKHA
jgi:hypothetical protein